MPESEILINQPVLPNIVAISWLDMISLSFFVIAWWAYAMYADEKQGSNLLNVTNRYRLQWMREMLKRDVRTVDAIMVGNLLRSISFFANTTIFILIGLMTLLGYGDKADMIIKHIPFAEESSGFLWEVKVFLLLIIFIYAFFKYTWSLRQYNYAGIYIVAAPPSKERVEEHEEIAQRGAWMVSNAAKHFNNGLRAYYFGLAVLGWFVHPVVFMVATALVVFVTYRREFRSGTLNNLTLNPKA